MKTLKDKITEVTDHIREALVSNEFEFVSNDEQVAKIVLCGVNMQVWIPNAEEWFQLADTMGHNMEGLKLFKPFYEKDPDRVKAYENVMAHVNEASKATNLLQIAELEELLKTKKASL